MFKRIFFFCALLIISTGNAFSRDFEFVIVQINDVYEITPLGNGSVGGLARVATVVSRLKAKNPNTMVVLSGDFLSPSALGHAKVDGEKLAGRQMVSVLNEIKVDYAIFGNHEFDLAQDALRKRIQEARFPWLSGNVTELDGTTSFANLPVSAIKTFWESDTDRPVRLGIVSVCIPTIIKDPVYAKFGDPLASAQKQFEVLEPNSDVQIALTHLSFGTDIQIAEKLKGLDLIIGGHEHENIFARRGRARTPIAKADSNAKSIYIHVIRVNLETRAVTVDSSFMPITPEIEEEPHIKAVVDGWVDRAFKAFEADGFKVREVIATSPWELDGLEESVRGRPTLLTQLVGESLLDEIPGSELAVFSGGAIRIDDILLPGPLTGYDVLRILPFPDLLYSAKVEGAFLKELMRNNDKGKGTGSYLQFVFRDKDNPVSDPASLIDPNHTYLVGTNEFSIKRFAKDFKEPQAGKVQRNALFEYLKKKFPPHSH